MTLDELTTLGTDAQLLAIKAGDIAATMERILGEHPEHRQQGNKLFEATATAGGAATRMRIAASMILDAAQSDLC